MTPVDLAPAASVTVSRRRVLTSIALGVAGLAAACAAPAATPTAAPKPTTPPSAPTTAPASAPSAAPAASPVAAASPSAVAKPAAAVTTAPAVAARSLGAATQVMNWFAQPSQGGLWAAQQAGYYKAAGIDMTTDQGGPGIAATPLVASGKYTFGMSSADSILLARQEGIPVVALFAPFQTNPQGFMYHQESGIKDFPDLNGHKVYVASAGAFFWDYIKAKYKLDKAEQLSYNGQLATWLGDKNNVTQCFVVSEPFFAKKAGANPGTLLNANSGYNPYQNMMFTSEQTIKAKPDLVKAYVQATLQGWKLFTGEKSGKEATFAFIKTFNKDQQDDAMENEWNNMLDFVTGGDAKTGGLGVMTDVAWKRTHDQLREIGALKKDIDISAAFNVSFLKA